MENKKIWIVTGVSGSGRREMLQNIEKESGGDVVAFDVGERMLQLANSHGLCVKNDKILDIDNIALTLLRAIAVQEIKQEIKENKTAMIFVVGVHVVFPWRGRIIPGISTENISTLVPTGVINVVNDVKEVMSTNKKNPKWQGLGEVDTQYWMMEEEYVSKLLSEFLNCDYYVVARMHDPKNLLGILLKKKKKRIYLSYPITGIIKDNPDFFQKLESSIVPRLNELFVVFNPLYIKDLAQFNSCEKNKALEMKSSKLKKERTVERDFSFIDQSDAIVVFYETEKHSPGVAAEIEYAHRNTKDVFMYYPHSRSPFLERAADEVFDDLGVFWEKLVSFSGVDNKEIESKDS